MGILFQKIDWKGMYEDILELKSYVIQLLKALIEVIIRAPNRIVWNYQHGPDWKSMVSLSDNTFWFSRPKFSSNNQWRFTVNFTRTTYPEPYHCLLGHSTKREKCFQNIHDKVFRVQVCHEHIILPTRW